MNRQALARLGEATACDYLAGAGFALRHRNWRCPEGEIDIVAEKAGGLVMVEVKTRSSMHYGAGEEAVTPRKLARIERCAWAYLGAHALLEQPWRVDVIAVDVDRQGRVTRLNHLEDVLQT